MRRRVSRTTPSMTLSIPHNACYRGGKDRGGAAASGATNSRRSSNEGFKRPTYVAEAELLRLDVGRAPGRGRVAAGDPDTGRRRLSRFGRLPRRTALRKRANPEASH